MRISDWSSDVCSSDLVGEEGRDRAGRSVGHLVWSVAGPTLVVLVLVRAALGTTRGSFSLVAAFLVVLLISGTLVGRSRSSKGGSERGPAAGRAARAT